jgi:hypothetical protein
MHWTIAYDDAMEVIRVTVQGDLTVEGINAMTAALLGESRRLDVYRFLCDCRGISLGMGLAQIYRLPIGLRRLGVKSYHMVALVYSDGPLATPRFTIFDDRCQNAGLNHKVFTDYDLACLWLTGINWSIVSGPACVAV